MVLLRDSRNRQTTVGSQLSRWSNLSSNNTITLLPSSLFGFRISHQKLVSAFGKCCGMAYQCTTTFNESTSCLHRNASAVTNLKMRTSITSSSIAKPLMLFGLILVIYSRFSITQPTLLNCWTCGAMALHSMHMRESWLVSLACITSGGHWNEVCHGETSLQLWKVIAKVHSDLIS